MIFEQGNFNENQKFTFLEKTELSVNKIATIMRELSLIATIFIYLYGRNETNHFT